MLTTVLLYSRRLYDCILEDCTTSFSTTVRLYSQRLYDCILQDSSTLFSKTVRRHFRRLYELIFDKCTTVSSTTVQLYRECELVSCTCKLYAHNFIFRTSCLGNSLPVPCFLTKFTLKIFLMQCQLLSTVFLITLFVLDFCFKFFLAQ